MQIAVYPGSFDPPTSGHMDIVHRAASLFERVIVAIGTNPGKEALFSVEERVQMLSDLTSGLGNVEVSQFSGLLVDFARRSGATVVVRGLRAVSDFEMEFQMSLTNRMLAPEVETVFLMTTAEHMFVSSSIVKEVAALGGDVSRLVPEVVAARVRDKFVSK